MKRARECFIAPLPRSEERKKIMVVSGDDAGDIDGQVKPSELVDWYVGMLRQKGMIK